MNLEKNMIKQCSLLKLIEDAKRLNVDWLSFIPEYLEIEREVISILGDDFSCVERIGNGANSKIYKIGDFVLKIGNYRYPEKVPNLDEINHVYLRCNRELRSKNKVIYLGLEIQDYLEENARITEDDLRRLYMSLRKKGYIWCDAKISNVRKDKNGILKIIDTDYILEKKDPNIFVVSEFSKQFEKEYNLKA